MPRIRTLKPEHRQHRKVGILDHFTYRLWIGMILEADDEGRLVAEPAALRSQIYPYMPHLRLKRIQDGLAALNQTKLVRIYTVDDTQYAWFPSWHDHQVVNKPRPSRLPAYPDSRSPTGPVPDRSRSTTGGSRSEGRELDRKDLEPDPPPARPVGAAASLEIFRLQQQQAEKMRQLQRGGK